MNLDVRGTLQIIGLWLGLCQQSCYIQLVVKLKKNHSHIKSKKIFVVGISNWPSRVVREGSCCVRGLASRHGHT